MTNSLFWSSIFVKCHAGLLLRVKEATPVPALLSVCEQNNRCAMTRHKQTLKKMTWLVTNHDMHVYVMIYGLKSLQWSMYFVTLMVNIRWYLEFELCCWGADVIWPHHSKWNSYVLESCKMGTVSTHWVIELEEQGRWWNMESC